MQDRNRERNILLRAELGIALGSWYGECNVNSRKDRNLGTGATADTPDLKKNRKRDKNESFPNLHSWLRHLSVYSGHLTQYAFDKETWQPCIVPRYSLGKRVVR